MPYIGNQPGTGVRSRFIYTATASQTTFSGADNNSKTLKYADSAYVDVFLNGVCLVPGTDYTASTKTSVVLTQAASVSDTLEVVAYDIATIADTVSKADGGTFEDGVTIRTADNTTQLTLESTDPDANDGPLLRMYRNSGSPADSDLTGMVKFSARNDNSQDVDYATIRTFIRDASDGTEDGTMQINHMVDGTLRTALELDNDEYVFNNAGIDIDFRVESDDNATGIFLDASESSLGIGVGTADTTTARMSVALTGAVTAGDTDGATIGKEGIFRLVDDTNWSSSNSTLFLMGGGTASGVGQIASAIGFARESNTNWGTQLKFYTHPTPTTDLDDLDERMRIDASGNLLVGTTSTFDASDASNGSDDKFGFISRLDVERNNSAAAAFKRCGGNGTLIHLARGGSGVVGTIGVDTGAASFNTSSDHRLKENVEILSNGITRVKQLNPKRFSWIVDEENSASRDGFLAHEAQTVVPEAVTGAKDAMKDEEYEVKAAVTDDDGNVVEEAVMGTRSVPDMQGIDQAKLVPLLTAALQEAIAKIETLETKVAALEAG